MKYILFVLVLVFFVLFIAIIFSDLRASLKSIVRSLPPDNRAPKKRVKTLASKKKRASSKTRRSPSRKTTSTRKPTNSD